MTHVSKALRLSAIIVLISTLLYCGNGAIKPARDIDIVHFNSATMLARSIKINGQEKPMLDNMIWTYSAIANGLPATVAPAGLCDSGLPVGIQIIGARFEDRTTIAFAKGLSELLGGFKAPPGYED